MSGPDSIMWASLSEGTELKYCCVLQGSIEKENIHPLMFCSHQKLTVLMSHLPLIALQEEVDFHLI